MAGDWWEPPPGSWFSSSEAPCPDDWHRNNVLDKPCPECGTEIDPAWVWYDPPATTPKETR
jgi:hypothetical protein